MRRDLPDVPRWWWRTVARRIGVAPGLELWALFYEALRYLVILVGLGSLGAVLLWLFGWWQR